jgi:DNA-binding XRE family transcriptional regulator
MWRQRNKVTLVDLANRVGVSAAHLCEIELGRGVPSWQLARRLAKATALPIDAIGPDLAEGTR